jgi:hypothetical protein
MKRIVFRPETLLSIAVPFVAALLVMISVNAIAGSKTFTVNTDFDLGAFVGVNDTAVSDQLQLNITGSSFPVLWIANAGEDTLSKVDSTQTSGGAPGREIARYRTWFNSGAYAHDAWSGAAPSRTAVDKDGNAYVLDRAFNGYPTLFKIFNTSFVDRNGNGIVDTSVDTSGDGKIQVTEMKPLVDTNGNSIIDPTEIQDERIAWVKRVPDGSYANGISRYTGIGRALCIGTDGNLWVGLYNNYEYYKVSAVDGHTIAGPVNTGTPNYGCLIDHNGTLWGASWEYGSLVKIENTANDTGVYPVARIPIPNAAYGLALRRDENNFTRVIMGGSCNSYVEYNTATNSWVKPAAVNYCSYAVGTDNSGNILVSKRDGGVIKFAPNGSVLWDKASQVGSADSRGVISDANNNIWQVHRATHNMAKYKGSDGSFLGVLPIGYEPYTYSDASGTAALSVTTKTGSWSGITNSGAPGTKWGTISWNSSTPTGSSILVQARASDSPSPSGLFTTVTNGTEFSLVGQYIEIVTTLNANTNNQSPVVYDLTVKNSTCDVNGDGSINKTDILLITAARNAKALSFDSRDADGDGMVTVNDARACTLRCTKVNCAL